jgi:hypothetical protein
MFPGAFDAVSAARILSENDVIVVLLSVNSRTSHPARRSAASS